MKPKLAILCLLMILFGVVTIVSEAQVNNPLFNPDANSCFPGGAFAGMCDKLDVDEDGDVDTMDSDWCWNCGWYHIRVEYGIYPQSVLDGVCKAIPPVVVEEEAVDDDADGEHKVEKEPDIDKPTGGPS